MQNNCYFAGLDLYTNQTLQANQNIYEQLKGERIILTAIPCDQCQFEPFYQKSTQNLTNDYEISFEKHFMTQHSSVFKKQLSNYMEFARIYFEQDKKKVFPLGLYDLNTRITCKELLSFEGIQISQDERIQYFKDLDKYEKLQEFLDVVADFSPSQIAIELIQISQQILQHFMASDLRENKHCSTQELLNLAAEKISDLKNLKLINLKNLSKKIQNQADLQERYQRFIEIYCSTTILVIGQCFENPFHQEYFNNFKRPFSFSSDDEEDEIEPTPQKKRKFNF